MRPLHKPRTRWERRYRRHLRVRTKIAGTADRPRLVVYRSLKYVYAQLVDDTRGATLAAATDRGLEVGATEGKSRKVNAAFAVGKLIAERAKAAGITRVVFDRAGYRYHGRVRAVAEGARKGGLEL
jgi:large subunit ribosomal protein L18